MAEDLLARIVASAALALATHSRPGTTDAPSPATTGVILFSQDWAKTEALGMARRFLAG